MLTSCRTSPWSRWGTFLLAAALAVEGLLAGSSAAWAQDGPTLEDAPLAQTLVREASDYGWRRWVRQRVFKPADEERYGLHMEEGWEQRPAERPVVVLVHGFNSTTEKNTAVLDPIREQEFPCGGFCYPNDHTLGESAARLSRSLREFAADHPDRQVVLVTHSMGGLVARACLEDPTLDPGNVVRLVQIAPPTHGTLLAHAAVATDLWEHWLGRSGGGAWTRWRDSVVDGLGEAADDLVPGSPFLAELNARPRNPHVHYTILLGTTASMSSAEMDWVREAVAKTGGRLPGLRSTAEKVGKLLDDMDELVDGKGDGVVAVKRGRLDGVDDVVVIPFGHLTCTACDCEDGSTVQREVLARLR